MSGWTTCPRCTGSGTVIFSVGEWGKPETGDCPLCAGTGEVRADTAMWWLEQAVQS